MRLFRQTVRVTETRHHICAIFEMDANRGRFTQQKNADETLSVYS